MILLTCECDFGNLGHGFWSLSIIGKTKGKMMSVVLWPFVAFELFAHITSRLYDLILKIIFSGWLRRWDILWLDVYTLYIMADDNTYIVKCLLVVTRKTSICVSMSGTLYF